MTTDNTQELDEILLGHGAEEGEFTESLKQAILDWHTRRLKEAVREARIDELNRIQLRMVFTSDKKYVSDRIAELKEAE